MKILIAALLFFSCQSQAATFESLTQKALRQGAISETIYGFTKSLERREGSQVAYFTLDVDPQSGQPKRFSAVLEDWQKTPEGKLEVSQTLLYFTPEGGLDVLGQYLILLGPDKSFESRKELYFGEPRDADLERWNKLLANW